MTKYILSSITALHANNILRQIFVIVFVFFANIAFEMILFSFSLVSRMWMWIWSLLWQVRSNSLFRCRELLLRLKDILSTSLILVSLSFSLPPALSFYGEKRIWCSWTMSVRFRDFLFESVIWFVLRQCCFRSLCVPVGTVETRRPNGYLCHLLNTGMQRHCGVIYTGTAGSYDLYLTCEQSILYGSLLHTISLRKIAHWADNSFYLVW